MRFEVPGHPIGYYAEGRNANWDRRKQYRDYMQKVRVFALKAGLLLPLTRPDLVIGTVSYFRDGVHSDAGNVQKGVCDELYYCDKKRRKLLGAVSDKMTGGWFMPPLYDEENPRCEVYVSTTTEECLSDFSGALLKYIDGIKLPPAIKKTRKQLTSKRVNERLISFTVLHKCGHNRNVEEKEVRATGRSIAEYAVQAGETICEKCSFK